MLGLGVGLAVAWGVIWLARDPSAEPTVVRVVSAMPEPAAASRSSELAAEPAPVPNPNDPDPEPDGDAPRVMPQRAELPLDPGLAAETTSAEPHRLLGAWDEDPESASAGQRRAFIVLVDPGIDDASLERLARDLRDRHRDASILDVRIYDDESAALEARALDGGRRARLHLVGEVKTHQALALDVLRVRGRTIAP